MLLKYNIKNVNKERNIIDVINKTIVENTDDYYCIKVTTFTNHNLKVGDIILLNRNIITVYSYKECLDKLTNYKNKIVLLLSDDILYDKDEQGKDIIINYDKGYYWLKENRVTKLTNTELDLVFKIYNSNNNNNFQVIDNYYSNDTFSFIYPKYNKIRITDIFDGDNKGSALFEGDIYELYNEGDIFYIEQRGGKNKKIKCTYISSNCFSYLYEDGLLSVNEIYEVKDNRFIDNSGNLYNDITFYEFNRNISLNLTLNGNIGYGLDTENIIKHYFEEKKGEILPNIIDYEKKCFSPVLKNKNGELNSIESIKFDIFLRDRIGTENWNTNDNMGWNQYRIDNKGKFILNENITNGDLLGLIGFTDEDVYYQKKKLSKSFLRLSFYDTNNPLTQMLLFYSTIFIDTNELYGRYIKNVDKKIKNPLISLVHDNTIDNPLTLTFKLNDRYDKNNSSEGYYLYLFPDNLQKNNSRIIYMKAEFNHAGYGKTIPLILPNDNKLVFNFSSPDFPESLITENDNNLNELYRQMFIPVTIKYDEKNKDYVYFFHLVSENNDNNILLRLFEPKINPLN